MKTLLVIGGSISQFPTIVEAKNMGIKTVVVDKNFDALCKDLADVFEVVDVKNLEGVLDVAKRHNINAVLVPGTDFPETGSYIAEQLVLPSCNMDVSKRCSNKILMRERLRTGGCFVPNFVSVKKDYFLNYNSLKYPLVVKPVDNMAARGVKKIYNYLSLSEAIKKAISHSRSKQVIVEEFVSGMEFSIDALVYNGEVTIFAFADRHFALDPYLIEIGHTMPTILDKDLVSKISKEFIKAVKVLGIDNGAAKGDVKLTSEGIMIGEIAARISGGFLSGWTVPYAYGTNPHRSLIKIAFGEKPEDLTPYHYYWSAERVFMSIPGKIKQIIDEHDSIIPYVHFHVKEGDEVYFPIDNAKRCGSVLSRARQREVAINDAREGIKNIFLRLEPNNNETDKFLYGIHYFHEQKNFTMFEPGKKETDWHEMDLQEALYRIKYYTGKKNFFSKNFWKAFYKGGVQGGVYYVDSLKK